MSITSAFNNIEKLETDLWEAADNLRANSKLTSSDYFMPVLGVIFLRRKRPDRKRAHPGTLCLRTADSWLLNRNGESMMEV